MEKSWKPKRKIDPTMKKVFGILTFVTFGMIIVALFHIAFIGKLEGSYGTEFSSFLRMHKWQNENDKEAQVLSLGYIKPEVISWSPRITVLHNFLSMEECDYLRAIARPYLHASEMVDETTGNGVKSDVRTSGSMFLGSEAGKYPMIQAIEIFWGRARLSWIIL